MTTRQVKAAALADQISGATVELKELLTAEGTLQSDERLEHVRQTIEVHIRPELNSKLRYAHGHKGGFRGSLARIDGVIDGLLQDLDNWEIKGIPPESHERLTQMVVKDKQKAQRAADIEDLLHDMHSHFLDGGGLGTEDDPDSETVADQLADRYAALFQP